MEESVLIFFVRKNISAIVQMIVFDAENLPFVEGNNSQSSMEHFHSLRVSENAEN